MITVGTIDQSADWSIVNCIAACGHDQSINNQLVDQGRVKSKQSKNHVDDNYMKFSYYANI